MGFCEVLTLIFVVLKLCGVLAWSWFWVLFPLYPAFLFYAVVLFFCWGTLVRIGRRTR